MITCHKYNYPVYNAHKNVGVCYTQQNTYLLLSRFRACKNRYFKLIMKTYLQSIIIEEQWEHSGLYNFIVQKTTLNLKALK